jgi:glutaminyl-peptide cyclotransferase
MHCRQALLTMIVLGLAHAAPFSGSKALEYTARAVSFGPRPPGSQAIERLREYIVAQLKPSRCEVSFDAFTAATPRGPIAMKNVVCRFRGTSGRAVAVTGHYDTKWFPSFRFVGANDGGASTGFLLEFARAVSTLRLKNDVYVVFLDGEEAFGPWSDTDGVYGSRHLAATWAAGGVTSRLKALINVDMIGDRDLGVVQDSISSQSLRRLIWSTAAELGYGRYFLNEPNAITDDHIPFLQRGVNACDLIDFDYGPNHRYWHTAEDTLDKLSASSFQVIGEVVLATLKKLE